MYSWSLATFAVFITLGGMKVIGYTDVIQVLVLVAGGLVTTYLAINKVNTELNLGSFGNAVDFIRTDAADHFHMILNKGQMMMPDGRGGQVDAYQALPGLAVLIGAMWIANLNYWGCNQYITQRALGADLKTARSGLLFGSILKAADASHRGGSRNRSICVVQERCIQYRNDEHYYDG